MKAALKKKWLKALRGGKYEQGYGVLCQRGRYCCLGVLCEVAGVLRSDVGDTAYFYGQCVMPSDRVLADLGLSAGVADQLARYNDRGYSFAWIAANIERRKEL